MNSSERYNEITRIRQATTKLIEAIEELEAMKKNWIYLDLGNVLTVDDFINQHEGLTVADLTAVGGTTLDAIEALLAAGHGTNLYKIKIR